MATKFEINILCYIFIYTITFWEHLKKHVEIIIRLGKKKKEKKETIPFNNAGMLKYYLQLQKLNWIKS
jgi:hypothetical protein